MKTNKKYIHMAITSTVLHLSHMKGFAKELVDAISEDYPSAVELDEVKGNGFILRRKKDTQLTDSYITKRIINVIEKLMEDNYEDAIDYISENYDFVFKDSQIDESLVSEVFDINRNGRLIYIEVDISE